MMKRGALTLLCLLLATGFAGLGVWQVERRAWKLDLIARVEARIHAAPMPLPPRSRWGDDLAYTRVRLTGRYDNDRATLVQAVTDLGAGRWVMTPLSTPAGTVLINRGFVPNDHRRAYAKPAGPVVVTGLIRASEPGGGFLRRNDPDADRWYSRDVPAIARARQLGAVAPFFIDADATPNGGGWPMGGLTVIAFRNNHLIYAVTWFVLAALSMFGAAKAWRAER
jgi:surfeit locus 1 family protein